MAPITTEATAYTRTLEARFCGPAIWAKQQCAAHYLDPEFLKSEKWVEDTTRLVEATIVKMPSSDLIGTRRCFSDHYFDQTSFGHKRFTPWVSRRKGQQRS